MREFDSFAAFGRHLTALAAAGEAVTEHIAKKGGEVIRDGAQVKIGVYQEASGGFNAWAPLADATVMDRIRKGFTPFDPLLRTGGLRDSITVSVEGATATVGSPSDIALYQEQGTARIPPRPFLGPAAFEAKPAIGKVAVTILIAWLMGGSWRRPPQSIKLP